MRNNNEKLHKNNRKHIEEDKESVYGVSRKHKAHHNEHQDNVQDGLRERPNSNSNIVEAYNNHANQNLNKNISHNALINSNINHKLDKTNNDYTFDQKLVTNESDDEHVINDSNIMKSHTNDLSKQRPVAHKPK